jgi:hypothetical protein
MCFVKTTFLFTSASSFFLLKNTVIITIFPVLKLTIGDTSRITGSIEKLENKGSFVKEHWT